MLPIVRPPVNDRAIAVCWRMGCTGVAICVVQGAVCGLAALPVVLLWMHFVDGIPSFAVRASVLSILLMPSYLLFALCLMGLSALDTRGGRTYAGARRDAHHRHELVPVAMGALHGGDASRAGLCRNCVSGSPIWTVYLRLSGARIGRRVYVNSLSVSDHNLLEFGDDVVIGADVHLSGHTVEGGVVKTAAVRVGSGVTIGLGSVVGIGVEVDDRCQLGALSLVPKFSRLEAGAVYAGIPARRIDGAGADHTTRDVSQLPRSSLPHQAPEGPMTTDWLRIIRANFIDVPGLRLSRKEAERFWGLKPRECECLFDALVKVGVLRRTDRGQFVHATDTPR